MEFDIVVATRNRQSVLQLSIPLMVAQSRLPRRLIIVDSSDDHDEVRDVVGRVAGKAAETELVIIRSAAGSSHQRNVGLANVKAPIVFFPDDDSLWYPGAAEAMMRVYERDQEQTIGCVAPVSLTAPPPGVLETSGAPHRMDLRDRVAPALRVLTGPIEESLFPDPMNPGSRWDEIWGRKTPPPWLQEEGAELCGTVFGYRMSFRTDVVRGFGGFDELLGRYGLFEDVDSTLASLANHLNVCATRAEIFHFRTPGPRTTGWEFGVMAVLNRAYIVCKHSEPGAPARRALRRYLYYKLFRYMLQSPARYGRERLRGALQAMPRVRELLDAHAARLSSQYSRIRAELLAGTDQTA